jgi:ATP synthase protein I
MLDKAIMPFNRPIPNSKSKPRMSSGVEAIVQAEKLMQIALLLPSAVGVGWLLGAIADHQFHQSWIAIAGIIFGAVSGLVYVFRMALAADKDSYAQPKSGEGAGNGNSSPKS